VSTLSSAALLVVAGRPRMFPPALGSAEAAVAIHDWMPWSAATAASDA
jgi:hypothetical protein